MRLDKFQACFSAYTLFVQPNSLNKPEFRGRKRNVANFSARGDALGRFGLRHVNQSPKNVISPFRNAMSLLAVLILTFGGELAVSVSQSDFYPTGVIANLSDENFEMESNMSIYTASSSQVFVSL